MKVSITALVIAAFAFVGGCRKQGVVVTGYVEQGRFEDDSLGDSVTTEAIRIEFRDPIRIGGRLAKPCMRDTNSNTWIPMMSFETVISVPTEHEGTVVIIYGSDGENGRGILKKWYASDTTTFYAMNEEAWKAAQNRVREVLV